MLNQDRVNKLSNVFTEKANIEEVRSYKGSIPINITSKMLNDPTVYSFTFPELLEVLKKTNTDVQDMT